MTPALTGLYDARFFVTQHARKALTQYQAMQRSPEDSLYHAESAADLAHHMAKLEQALAQEERAVAVLEGRSAPEAA